MIAEATEQVQAGHKPCKAPTDADRRLVRSEFVQGLGSGRALAKAHNLNPITVNHWIARGGWQALKDKREAAELAKLNQGALPTEEIKPQGDSQLVKLQRHLERIDETLDAATDSRDVVNLMRARRECQEAIHIERHGAKPGTMKPASNRRRQSTSPVSPTFEPEAGS